VDSVAGGPGRLLSRHSQPATGERFGDEGIVRFGADRRHGGRSDSPNASGTRASGFAECRARTEACRILELPIYADPVRPFRRCGDMAQVLGLGRYDRDVDLCEAPFSVQTRRRTAPETVRLTRYVRPLVDVDDVYDVSRERFVALCGSMSSRPGVDTANGLPAAQRLRGTVRASPASTTTQQRSPPPTPGARVPGEVSHAYCTFRVRPTPYVGAYCEPAISLPRRFAPHADP
jgi:hypothetical protein